MPSRRHFAPLELVQSVLAGTDLPAVMQQAAAHVTQTLGVEFSAIWELRVDREALAFRAGTGWRADQTDGAITIPALLGAGSTVVVDWRRDPPAEQPPLLCSHGVHTSIYVTIPGQATPFGVLSADSPIRRTFSGADITYLQELAGVLALAVDKARLATASVDKAVLEERQRLARDLHDSVIQALYSVTLHAQAASRLLTAGDLATVATYLGALQTTAQEALDEMRLLIFELRPPILEQAGLAAALQARLDTVEGRANLETSLSVEGTIRLAPYVEQMLYRIAQEALNNILKHAHASRIAICLKQARSIVTLEISDDGIGFDPVAARVSGGLGLRGIEERVSQVGGDLALRTAPGAGTRLRVTVAL
jgi:signal transduction histidine kinase